MQLSRMDGWPCRVEDRIGSRVRFWVSSIKSVGFKLACQSTYTERSRSRSAPVGAEPKLHQPNALRRALVDAPCPSIRRCWRRQWHVQGPAKLWRWKP
jgi:hypothetical protein